MAVWLHAGFAAIVVATATYHVLRLVLSHVRHCRSEVDVDLTHAATGTVMALMLVGVLAPGASGWWAVAFTAPTTWFAARTVHTYVMDGSRFVGHHARQVLTSCAMLYMLLVAAGTSPVSSAGAMHMADEAGTAWPGTGRAIGFVLVLAMIGVTIWTCRLIACARRSGPVTTLAPAMTATCQAAMSITTVYMLVPML